MIITITENTMVAVTTQSHADVRTRRDARVITCCQTMAYHKAVAIINNVGGQRAAAVSARAHARYEMSGRPRYGGRVWRGGRLLSSGHTRAVSWGGDRRAHLTRTIRVNERRCTEYARTDE